MVTSPWPRFLAHPVENKFKCVDRLGFAGRSGPQDAAELTSAVRPSAANVIFVAETGD